MTNALHWTSVATPPLLSGALLVLLVPLTWVYRRRPAGLAFLISIAATSIWSIAYSLELSCVDRDAAIFWANIQYFGIPTGPAATLAFVIAMTGDTDWLRRLRPFLIGIPVLMWLLVWTDGTHHLVRQHPAMVAETGYSILHFDRGPAYYLNVLFCYLCMGAAFLLLARLTRRRNPLTRRQAKTMLLGFVLPFLGNIAGVLGLWVMPGVDMTPILFSFSAVVTAYGVFRWSLITVVPIARDKVVDDLADGILVLDPELRVIDTNPAASLILGLRPDQLSRASLADLPLPDPVKALTEDTAFQVGEKTYFLRRSFLSPDGATPEGTILQFTDITESRRIEAELRGAKEAAEEASEVKTRFVANISHELRTPLNGVIGLAELLEETTLAPQQRAYLAGIRQCSSTLLGLISDVLDFSKLDANAMPIVAVPVEIAVLVEEVASVHRFLGRGKELAFRTEVRNMPPFILGDPLRLRQILHNLIGNAIKFTEHGSITISLTTLDNGRYEIRVDDTGIGIPAAMQSAVFEAFQQAEAATARRFGGTGLGLPITRGLVERMGGEISLTSELGVGTSIRIVLPLVPAGTPMVAKAEDEVPSGIRVLIAEDNEVNTLVITAMLERLGCVYVHAENGREAVDAFAAETFDIVLLDIQMPILDGIAACEEIRERWPDRRTPIYALTANAFEQERQRAVSAGMDGFLTKPLRTHDLATALLAAVQA